MEAAQIVATLGISMAANLLCIMAVFGMVQVSKHERDKTKPPGYVFALILVPAVLTISCLWFIINAPGP